VLDAATRDRIRTNFEAFFEGDLDGAVAMMAPDVVAIDAPEMPDSGVHTGRDELKARLVEFRELFDRFELQAMELHDLGEQVLAVIHVSAFAKAADMAVEFELAYLLEFSDGSVARLRSFLSEAQARDHASRP
jgi:ketosteroid isomerase-like protein